MKASWIEGTGKQTGRPMIMGSKGMVSSGNPLASLAGVRVLMEGGNVVDAAVATSAVLTVVRPHMTGLGGDLFCLIHMAGEGRVVAINASGPAPQAATIDYFRERGMDRVPMKGPLSVETPGCVAGWELALEKYGTMPLSRLVQPAVDYAENGFPVTLHLVQAIAKTAGQSFKSPVWTTTYLSNGRVPRPGEKLVQANLARTLRALQEGGPRAFYEGAIADTIARAVEEEGGLLTTKDLASCQAELLEPVRVGYRGYTVYEQPPVSQGHILLQELAIAEGFDLGKLERDSADAIHLMVECKKLAFADRIGYLGDPAFVDVPMKQLLSKEYASERRKSIDPDRAMSPAAAGVLAATSPDTTYLCVIDSEGNAVSLIQSLFHGFGSGLVGGDTGVVLNNRLSCFYLDPALPNALAPGKRTIHTLNSYMVFRDGWPFLAAGSPGADDQVQVSLQVISDLVDHGMSLQESIEAPRWSSTPGTLASDINNAYELGLENRFPAHVAEGLRQKGHVVKMAAPWSFGSVKAVLLDPESSMVYGGADPRRDGYAVGW